MLCPDKNLPKQSFRWFYVFRVKTPLFPENFHRKRRLAPRWFWWNNPVYRQKFWKFWEWNDQKIFAHIRDINYCSPKSPRRRGCVLRWRPSDHIPVEEFGEIFYCGYVCIVVFRCTRDFYGSNNRSLFTLPRASARNVHFLARALGTLIVSVFTLPGSARYSVQAIRNFIY